MPKKFELTLRAERDLKDIWIYTAKEWSVEQAEKYHALLGQRFEELIKMPFLGVERPDIENGYRCLIEGKHLIFYRVENETIIILGVPHASMDIDQYLEDD